MSSAQRSVFVLSVLMALASLGVAMARQARSERASLERESRKRPVAVHGDGYVSSSECRSCHPSEYASWHGSYHRTMTQVAGPESVKGLFDDVQLGGDQGLRLSRQGDRYFVQKGGPSAPLAPISLVTGSHHMQIYWYETGESRRLGQLPYAFLLPEQRWVPRGSVFLEPPEDAARPDEGGRWSTTCIRCHATQGQPRIEQGNYDTHVREFGIACEACHGPGQEHVASNRSPLARYASHLGADERASIVHPGKIDHARASEICSQCHAVWQQHSQESLWRWNKHGLDYRPGDDPRQTSWLFQPSQAASDPRVEDTLIRQPRYAEGQFWSDGAARVSGREFSGMIDSPCYEPGELSCLSCHTMHKRADDPRPIQTWANDQLGAGMEGDRACLQCHDAYAGEQQLIAHTRHPAASSGSRCYNCHMPHTSYGLMKAMRSHRIDVPSVQSTVKTGRPNACNACHLDRSFGWAADQLHARYGIERPQLTPDQEHVPSAILQGVMGDAGERALIAWALGWGPAQQASDRRFMPALLGSLMDDPYDSVRYIAERSLRSLPGVDTRELKYDYVPRPATRRPVAGEIARLGALPEPEAAKLASEIGRLKPLRDRRAVLLLE
jgi:Cytochrome c554 and c-prime